jgi:hypothetical protein
MLPSITVTGSPDGVQWAALGSKPARPVTVDVEEAVIPLAGAGRFLRLDFGARLPGMAMALSEVEVWGKQVGGP